ncbi:mandelate racemase/muconate lactonizing enzyme family protein [Rubrobacter taiwanensis]|jgi:L-alanine-DL-glutamate epimerase-like enolase superfamily enzyme|uniref:Mandelate racemase/muconate lactonizing enzyme family protein n=1 Tax=Rubrobacter taiwanensis TaxID=185139 RepID=A0A4R1B5R3_9ACTN|nr:mandelate racemase/muconate lactonizing enzyme family protein [Rubrobacter taiwanensis]TCJ13482.1 mandelate racemase/muconate lactonizing enzyme family protein [Rubrobacter taiwanensis]
MKITEIRTAVVEANYDWTFIKVYTDEGIEGLGESFLAPGLVGIIRDLEPLLVGEDPRNVDKLWSKMRWAASGAGSMGGIVYNAISGIEAALWDAVGKYYGAPICQLLGGRYRDRVRVYADCHAGEALEALNSVMVARKPRWVEDEGEERFALSAEVRHPVHGRAYGDAGTDEIFTPEMYAERARQVAGELGFTAIKFDLDVPNPYTRDTHSGTLTHAEIKFMVSLVEAVREAVGDEVDIAFDCHWRYNVSDARRLACELEPYGLMWLEDPVPPENVEAMRQVTQSTRTPIASGENYYLRYGFREALENGGLDIVAPDLQKTGGLLEGRRIADLADTHYAAVAPHCIASPVGTLASAHVAAAVPNFLALEWHGMSVPFWEDMVVGLDGPVIEDGYITVPDRPGLGVELNEEVARRYVREGEPFFGE